MPVFGDMTIFGSLLSHQKTYNVTRISINDLEFTSILLVNSQSKYSRIEMQSFEYRLVVSPAEWTGIIYILK